MKLEKGLVQIYTGNGKGKTTAAIGQGIRAYGNGLKVKMLQFLKGGYTGELKTIEELGENFKIYRFETKKDFVWNLNEEQIELLKKEIRMGYNFILERLEKNDTDVLIIDEIMGVLKNKFLTEEEVLYIIENKPENMEIIMTGRNVPDKIAEKADLVTEMKMIKHYYEKGIPSRKGIEF
ncbi:cob(I)yrinic acid a,c-diamide adenosyltransferase [Clostridium thermobutyricum]|uniref:Cob(I)yrinic acid a,c-diamide adenosyltransferase n=2 Tax=Clostridium thermobutyricum TaxID=29372 RepID=N9XQB4_9CLOT|nr:cob(I)yrinic acid a,c-diamide adenosyltransferase [Clostridium thermobutyricum]ENZ01908.1 cob(I)yrinic acid a,c-diamide adenosyltransferase [Clostridium thermobutyricum]OPX47996.1 Cob(I)yrinic acid a,c-diamide adenosyltransferase [Clostridium thermobutyricum DSM 4928]